jgi:hypothetical protein
MIRVAISAYLMLAAVAGPAQCCCVAARHADAVPADSPTTGRPDSAAAPSCCHARPANATKPAKHEHKGGPQDRPTCPCQDHAGLLISALPQHGLTADEFQRIAAVAPIAFVADSMHGSLLPGVSHPETAGAASLLFFDASDMLRLHHLLRC